MSNGMLKGLGLRGRMSDEEEQSDHNDDKPGKRAASARNVYATLRDELDALLAEVRAGETGHAKRLRPVVSELARAVARMADEEDKLDEAEAGREEAKRAGSAPNADVLQHELDLDAARDEVCRRLARLRTAE